MAGFDAHTHTHIEVRIALGLLLAQSLYNCHNEVCGHTQMHLHGERAHSHECDVVRGIQIPNHIARHGRQSLELRRIQIAASLADRRTHRLTGSIHHDYFARPATRKVTHE